MRAQRFAIDRVACPATFDNTDECGERIESGCSVFHRFPEGGVVSPRQFLLSPIKICVGLRKHSRECESRFLGLRTQRANAGYGTLEVRTTTLLGSRLRRGLGLALLSLRFGSLFFIVIVH